MNATDKTIAELKLRIKTLEGALTNMIQYASIVGSETDDVHIAALAYAKKALKR